MVHFIDTKGSIGGYEHLPLFSSVKQIRDEKLFYEFAKMKVLNDKDFILFIWVLYF